MWVIGKNCHLENIECPRCGSIETAYVLHTHPEFCRMHKCGQCGVYIGPFRWKLAAAQVGADAPDASQKPAVRDLIAETGDAAGKCGECPQEDGAPMLIGGTVSQVIEGQAQAGRKEPVTGEQGSLF